MYPKEKKFSFSKHNHILVIYIRSSKSGLVSVDIFSYEHVLILKDEYMKLDMD